MKHPKKQIELEPEPKGAKDLKKQTKDPMDPDHQIPGLQRTVDEVRAKVGLKEPVEVEPMGFFHYLESGDCNAGVMRIDGKVVMEVSPDFSRCLEGAALEAVVAHELGHVALKHVYSDDPDGRGKEEAADRFAAERGFAEGSIQALKRLDPEEADPSDSSDLSSSHPKLSSRIQMFEEYLKEHPASKP